MKTASVIINAVMFLTTFIIVVSFFRKDGAWQIQRGLKAFRYFTVLSNVFCAITALNMAICQAFDRVTPATIFLKYLGTVSVTVTILTVFLFLGPSQGGYGDLLRGENLYMHLIGPLLAILSFCLIEKQKMLLNTALTGVVPVLLYGTVYLYKVVYAPEERRWEDFYGFNKGGKWLISFLAMIVGTLVICVMFWVVCRG